MPRGSARRLRHLATLMVCVAAGLSAPASAGAVSSSGCKNRVNNTPGKLIPCIRTSDLWAHMQNFQAIADANPGPDGHASRNSGEPGYKASVDYVANAMRAAGYNVTIQTVQVRLLRLYGQSDDERGLTNRSQLRTHHRVQSRTEHRHHDRRSPAGRRDRPPADTRRAPRAAATRPTSPASRPGRVALIQRGTCTFAAEGAERPGCRRVGRDHLQRGQHSGAHGRVLGDRVSGTFPTIPVAFTSFDIGNDLYQPIQRGCRRGTALPLMSLEFHGDP